MNYNIFSFTAVVDFIEIEIHTASPTQGKAIKRKCSVFGISYAKRQGAKGSFSGSTFRIRLYDLKTFAALRSKIASIESEFPFARPPTVTMIEVAFDGRLNQDAHNTPGEPLATLAAHMAYYAAYPVSNNRRTYLGYKGSPQALPRFVHVLAREMAEGRNVGIGNKRDPLYQHGYLKTVDRDEQLPTHQHSARFEIRLAGAALPHHDIEGWETFKFQSLTKHLSFREVPDDLTGLKRAIIDGYGSRASTKQAIKRRDGKGTRSKHLTPADKMMNAIVHERLRSLTERWA